MLPKRVFLIIVLFTAAVAVANVDYSGTYVSRQKKHGKNTVLQVKQTESSIEVTRTEPDKVVSNRFPIDVSDGVDTSAFGVGGRDDKAEFKNGKLMLESVELTRPSPNGPTVRVRTREYWQLSSDVRTLTIKTVVEYSNPHSDISAARVPSHSSTDTYERVDTVHRDEHFWRLFCRPASVTPIDTDGPEGRIPYLLLSTCHRNYCSCEEPLENGGQKECGTSTPTLHEGKPALGEDTGTIPHRGTLS